MATTSSPEEANFFDGDFFLRTWSRDFLERLEDREFASFSSEVIEARWLGYLPATVSEIEQLQTRLNIKLPPSYRNFLTVSNGWRNLDTLSGRLFSTQEIDWLATRNQELIDAWMTGVVIGGGEIPISDEAYFVYGDAQDTCLLRDEYLQTALVIGGNPQEELILLNPQVIFDNGEWEAWLFAHWFPGAQRYKSFRELMLDMYSSLLDLLPKLRELP